MIYGSSVFLSQSGAGVERERPRQSDAQVQDTPGPRWLPTASPEKGFDPSSFPPSSDAWDHSSLLSELPLPAAVNWGEDEGWDCDKLMHIGHQPFARLSLRESQVRLSKETPFPSHHHSFLSFFSTSC